METALNDNKELIEEIIYEFDGKMDGGRNNILLSECPFCHHPGYKFGIYVGKIRSKGKRFGSSHCFCCGKSFRTLKDTLIGLGMENLIPEETSDLDDNIKLSLFDDEIDDELTKVEMPDGYKRTFRNQYLKSRGFSADDFSYFPCGTTRGMNSRYEDFVLIEIHDSKQLVGYVARKTWSKSEIDDYNDTHRYKVKRYDNSQENNFSKLLYNYDSVIEGETDTVILCEGVFDVIGLVHKMEMYENHRIVPVATFGKKISDCQIMKLQRKGVETIVIGYDNDRAAADSVGSVANKLSEYFNVFCIGYPKDVDKDFGDMSKSDIYRIFSDCIVTPMEYNLYSAI